MLESKKIPFKAKMTDVEQHRGDVAEQPVMERPLTQRGYIPSLDGWRAVAILWVMEAHSRPSLYGWFSDAWIVHSGYCGVQLFFALSGFLICARMLREEDRYGSISLQSFYTRRLFRIQPAAMTYLFTVAMLGLCGLIPRFWPGIVGAALMVRNFWPRRLGSGYWYTSHFWSLAVEEHFYLLLPIFLVSVKRHRLAILTGVALGLEAWRLHVLSVPPDWQILQRTDVVLDMILLGSLLTIALRQKTILRIAHFLLRPWVAIGYGAILFGELQRHNSSLAQTSLMTLFPLLVGATVLHPQALLSRFLELAPVRFIGRISYSLYLWQQLFFHPDVTSWRLLEAHSVLRWIAALACALASYYLIETPLIERGHRIAKRFDGERQPRAHRVTA